MKIANFVSLSIITRELLYPFDSGNSVMKSLLTTLKGWEGIEIGCSKPRRARCWGFTFWQISQVEVYRLMSLDILGQ